MSDLVSAIDMLVWKSPALL